MTSPTPPQPYLLSFHHALVDALCACCVFLTVPQMGTEAAAALFVAYNVLAFMTQPLVGLFIDRRGPHPHQHLLAIALLVLGAFLSLVNSYGFCGQAVSRLLPFLMVIFIGLGNSLFHVYGGKVVAVRTGNDMRRLGLFVSTGALGLLFGTECASPYVLLGLCALLLVTYRLAPASSSVSPAALPNAHWGGLAGVLLLIFLVFLRSLFGSLHPVHPVTWPYYAVMATVLAFVGKAGGGYVAHRVGVQRTLTLALLLAGCFFLLGNLYGLVLLVMTLCLNLTMPLTLHLANAALPRREGLAFGLLAAVLAPGVGLALYLDSDATARLLLYPLVATMVIEAIVLLLLRERRWQVLGLSLLANLFTNLSLNASVLYVLPTYPSTAVILFAELLIVLIEALFYRTVTHRWSQAFTYSIVCNTISFLLGFLLF